jgi:hypothetical protein
MRFGGGFPPGTSIINITGLFPIRLPDDNPHGTVPGRSELATVAGDRISGRVHYIFKLRMGDLHCGPGGLWTGMLNIVSRVMLGYVTVRLGSMLASLQRLRKK